MKTLFTILVAQHINGLTWKRIWNVIKQHNDKESKDISRTVFWLFS
ncbi:MAG: hypothetical protein IJ140_02995 [Prevotella sp.]|nr:hypothetical protein [Prevotella sp.]MBQ9669465.1 hypothetical protein [Prevotella sp.]